MDKLKFAIPKGSLEKATAEFFSKSGFKIGASDRTYRPSINDPKIELKVLRPQEIPVFVSEGLQDIGITGEDWVRENRADVEVLQNLEYGKIRLVIAVPKTVPEGTTLGQFMESVWDNGRNFRVSTEYLNIASEYLKNQPQYKKRFGDADPMLVTPWWRKGDNPRVKIFLSFGATEAKPPENSDCIMDVTETGTTIDANNLRIIETVLTSSAILISNKKALEDPEKREKIYDIVALLKGVVDGSKRVHIFVNVKKENLNRLLTELPSLKNPTISPLADEAWVGVNTVIEKDCFIALLPKIRKIAQGLVVYEPRQVLALDEISKREETPCKRSE
ncbi:MAG: ATP phosphoribosyltransferase [Candidatus Bathyarchaeota archaeon]|nr:ATP phosphoribosyltransferase [Candidatus Bathyarchaeota archaeon]MDT8781333.1 ATP phosphoribosyltransferase [Candidatus Bathyarchaeota archaeon]